VLPANAVSQPIVNCQQCLACLTSAAEADAHRLPAETHLGPAVCDSHHSGSDLEL